MYSRREVTQRQPPEVGLEPVPSNELSIDEVVAHQAEPHAPAPRVAVEHEVRSVVISAEVDDDLTPARGSPIAAVIEAEEAAAAARELPRYDRRAEPTIVIDRKRAPIVVPVTPRRTRSSVWFPLVVVGAGLLTLLVVFLIAGVVRGRRDPVAAPSASVPAAVSLGLESVEPAVDLSDLPVEPSPDRRATRPAGR